MTHVDVCLRSYNKSLNVFKWRKVRSEMFGMTVYTTLNMDKRQKRRELSDEIRKTFFNFYLPSMTARASPNSLMFM